MSLKPIVKSIEKSPLAMPLSRHVAEKWAEKEPAAVPRLEKAQNDKTDS